MIRRRYEFSERDLSVIGGHRGPANRFGFAVLLCYMRAGRIDGRVQGQLLRADDAPWE
jgi:hypothetical protein